MFLQVRHMLQSNLHVVSLVLQLFLMVELVHIAFTSANHHLIIYKQPLQ